MTTVTEALKAAHEQLNYLHDVEARHWRDGREFKVSAIKTLNKIEQALTVSERSLSERIERAYNEVIEQQGKILEAEKEIERPDNQEAERAATSRLHDARSSFYLGALEVKRLELLVELAKARDSEAL